MPPQDDAAAQITKMVADFKKSRNASLIFVLDRETWQPVWHWGPGLLDFPHMPTLLDNGNVLMSFTGRKRGAREVTPDKKVVWEYNTNSEVWGCQRLLKPAVIMMTMTTTD